MVSRLESGFLETHIVVAVVSVSAVVVAGTPHVVVLLCCARGRLHGGGWRGGTGCGLRSWQDGGFLDADVVLAVVPLATVFVA